MDKPSHSVCIAERKLLYSLPGESERRHLAIRIFAPFAVQPGTVSFAVDEGVAGCRYELNGLPITISDTAYGADSLQALQLATDVEGILRRLAEKYELYFPSGEGYFDE
jgi:hypothetical protein